MPSTRRRNRSTLGRRQLVVAFSGGPGASEITTQRGGRSTLIAQLQNEFPNIHFLRSGANHSTDIIIIPNGVVGASPSKLSLAPRHVQVMSINEFLTRMGRRDLVHKLGVRARTDRSVDKKWRHSRSSRGYRNPRAEAYDRSLYAHQRPLHQYGRMRERYDLY